MADKDDDLVWDEDAWDILVGVDDDDLVPYASDDTDYEEGF